MKATLDIDRTKKKSIWSNPRTLAAMFLGLGMFIIFWYVLHSMERAVKGRPYLIMMFPAMGIAILLAFLPLVLFCCYQEDFGNLNVLKPKDYLFLVRKTYNAIRDNNWKITAKDL